MSADLTVLDNLGNMALMVGARVVGAIILWAIGRMAIRFARKLVKSRLAAKALDPTASKYLDSALSVLLNLILVVAILGLFGVETTTFAAVLAAAGVAIGMAWSGLLANFAAGAFIMVLRPFKVGDFIESAGVTGTVVEIGLFVTVINQMDGVRTIVGNNALFSSTIRNFSANPHRRVELVAQLAHGVDVQDAIARLKARLAEIDHVATTPAPEVNVLQFTLAGPVLSVRPYTHNDHYWQVYFDTNAAIKAMGGEAGYPVPEQHFRVAPPPAA